VFTGSSLGYQTTPAFIAINDTSASVSNMSFVDLDLDQGELGGELTWNPSADEALVISYSVYLAQSLGGAGRSLIFSQQSTGTNSVNVAANTDSSSSSFLAVYAESTLAEQTTPTAVQFSDIGVSALAVSFTDLDLDATELGGSVTWQEPASASLITQYNVFLDENGAGQSRTSLGSSPLGVNALSSFSDVSLSSYKFVSVFCRSTLAEQTTPASVNISDTSASISNIQFLDLDLDQGELGGNVTWSAPAAPDGALVTSFAVFLAANETGAGKTLIAYVPGPSTSAAQIASETLQGVHTHILVFTGSSLGYQTTPSSIAINDTSASVSNMSFVDLDLDQGELGGELMWNPSADESLVISYSVYLAQSLGCRAILDL